MRLRLFTAALLILGLVCAPVAAQEGGDPSGGGKPKEGEAAAPLPPTKEVTEKLADAAKGNREDELRSAVELALKKYREPPPPAEKKDLLKALAAYGIGSRSEEIVEYTLKGFAELDQDAAPTLEKALGVKSVKKTPPALIAGIRSLGILANPGSAKTLLNLLNDKDYSVIAAACEALGGYENAAGGVRKEVVEKLVILFESTYNTSRDTRNTAAVQKYEAIETPILASLKKLTGKTFQNSVDWRNWFNDEKKKKW